MAVDPNQYVDPDRFNDPGERQKLEQGVRAKIRRLARRARYSDPVQKLIRDVRLLGEMAWDSDFPLSWTTRIAVLGALAYFLIPSDAIPDLIPGLGLIDDASVIGLVLHRVRGELIRYKAFRDVRDDDIIVVPQVLPENTEGSTDAPSA